MDVMKGSDTARLEPKKKRGGADPVDSPLPGRENGTGDRGFRGRAVDHGVLDLGGPGA